MFRTNPRGGTPNANTQLTRAKPLSAAGFTGREDGDMTATVQARGVAASYGDRDLFSGLDLVVAPGDVVGLVGPNGAGKTTLLRVLAGQRPPDRGTVRISPATAHIGYLGQEPDHRGGESVRAHLARSTGVAEAQAQFDRQSVALAGGGAVAEAAYSTALEAWLALGAADFDERLAAVADEIGLGVDLDLPVTALSGGQAAAALWRHLRAQHLAPPEQRIRPHLPLPVDALDDGQEAPVPPLIRGYLRCGATVLGAPAWDPSFDVADFPLFVDRQRLPALYRRRSAAA